MNKNNKSYNNPYNNKYIFKILSNHEIYLIDKVWKFINSFKEEVLTKSEYISLIINKIKFNYSAIDFFIYETIVEKMYWNLFYVIVDKVYVGDKIKENFKITQTQVFRNLLKNSLIGKSSLRKAFVHNKKHHSYMYKYDYPNTLDLILFQIMSNRSTYETILSNPDLTLDEINSLVEPYQSEIEFDYPFPNLNTIKPFVYSSKERLSNIKKYYYSTNSEQFWTFTYM